MIDRIENKDGMTLTYCEDVGTRERDHWARVQAIYDATPDEPYAWVGVFMLEMMGVIIVGGFWLLLIAALVTIVF